MACIASDDQGPPVEAHDSFPLLALPDEIVVMILQRLRLPDQVNAYESCVRLRALLAERSVLPRCCVLGRSALATVAALSRPLLRDLAPRIHYLDLTCVYDLSFTKLAPALKRMTNLIGLDVSRTNLNLPDLMRKGFPSLKHICVNYDYEPVVSNKYSKMKILLQSAERIHVVGNKEYPFSDECLRDVLPTCSKLKELQFTCNNGDFYLKEYISKTSEVRANAFHINFDDKYGLDVHDIKTLNGFELCFIENYENLPKVLMSMNLYKMFKKSNCLLSCPVELLENDRVERIKTKFSLYMWHNKIVKHNLDFYDKILLEMETKIANYVCVKLWSGLKPYKQHFSNSYFMSICLFEPSDDMSVPKFEPQAKKRRSRLENMSVNIDKYIQTNKTFKLTIGHFCSCNKMLYGCLNLHFTSLLRNLTFLHIRNVTSLHTQFFVNLFQVCRTLITLNLESDRLSVLLLCNALHLTNSLKNLRIQEPANSHSKLYQAMSTCVTLENVHICDAPYHMEVSDKCLTDFVMNCKRLYSFRVYSNFTSAAKKKHQKQLVKKVACDRNIHVAFIYVNNLASYKSSILNEDPYIDIFFQESVYRSFHIDLAFPPEM